jgi:hypothetical protein
VKPEDVTPELLDWLKTTAERSSEFVEREAPLLANEVVAWHFWSSVFLASAILFFSFALLGFATWLWRMGGKDPRECSMIVFLVGLLIWIPAIINGYEAVKASVAPRVVILEYVKGAMK